jgi:hypothetical protein
VASSRLDGGRNVGPQSLALANRGVHGVASPSRYRIATENVRKL